MVRIDFSQVFTLAQAEDLLPIVARITREAKREVDLLTVLVERQNSSKKNNSKTLEVEINTIVEMWSEKLRKLGVRAQGLWIADFDSGDGYFCWRHPETKIKYWHGYDQGYSGRIPVSEWQERRKCELIQLVSDRPTLYTV